MAKSAIPLLALAGGAALLLSGGKKKKKSSTGGTGGVDPYSSDDIPPYIPPTPGARPEPASNQPAGPPPRRDSYDEAYWGATSAARLTSIRQHFADLGYPMQVSAHPVNILGPKGTIEFENIDGTMGKMGGGDDQPNATAKKLQHEYNVVSRLNQAEKFIPGNMGGLDEDGKVGPYTLNGLRTAKELTATTAKRWPDLVMMAANKGIA